MQLLRKHYARYTPEFVAENCGCSVEQFLDYCRAVTENSGRERTGAFCYAVGWTQHTVGVQIIRTAAIVQQLLGNIGRPGGGILALRGHASIQGSTDIPTLYNILPGYLPMPHTEYYGSFDDFVDANVSPTGWWGNFRAYWVSLMKAYFGQHATEENEWLFRQMPRIDSDNSAYWTTLQMLDGKVKGYIVAGENPAVGNTNAKAHRLALANLEWLVVRDLVEIETASFWYDSPEIESGELKTEQIPTELFFLPAAAHTEKDGSFTNTQRLLQWHWQATEPKEDCRSELWFYFHLGRSIKQKLADSREERDLLVKALRWEYPTHSQIQEPDAEAVLQEISGRTIDTGEFLESYPKLAADGSTLCGCWIYCGVFKDGINQAARKEAALGSGPRRLRMGVGVAGQPPPDLQPGVRGPGGAAVVGAQAVRVVGRGRAEVDRPGRPRLPGDEGAGYVPPGGAKAEDAIAGNHPFVMQADGRSWLFVPQGLEDGPLPTHYEPHESPFANSLYGQRANPARQQFERPENPYNPVDGEPGAEVYPYVATTYRLTEHHTAGGMTRTVPYLAELQPAMFVEVDPELAEAEGLEHGSWATIYSSRGAIEARVLVTDRIKPIVVQGRKTHQIGLPYHWGTRGLTTGGSANDLPRSRSTRMSTSRSRRRSRSGSGPAGGPKRPRTREHGGRSPARRPAGMPTSRSGETRMGFFTDTSVCIGCKACEVACKEWNLIPEDGLEWTGESYDNTSALGANTWRHVAFVEQAKPLRDGDAADALRWLMSSDVCKHCTHAACLDVCPTGSLFRTEFGTVVVQEDICNGCGYCVPACPFGVLDKRQKGSKPG